MRPGSSSEGPGLRAGSVLRGAQGETFEVTGELGRGGMGVVLRARDPRSGREVALKLARPTTEQTLLSRLEREGQLAARLNHPGIVRVHGAGTIGDRPYVAYELVEGARTLAQVLPELDRAARVAIVRDVARALGAAHALGVVHRDVKPDNVLLGADGRARVSDFGIATAADVERLTVTGAFMGTAHYMAPEQLIGLREGIGPPVDVWSLGVTLYLCLTDALPFDGQSLVEVVGRISDGAPVPPRKLRPELPADLEAVCLKALARSPAARYAEAGALADDLERALTGRPVEAARRGPRPVVVGLAVALLLVGAGALLATTRATDGGAPDGAQKPAADDRRGSPVAGVAPPADPRTEAEAALARGEPDQALRLAGGLPEGPERVSLEARALLDLRRPAEAARRAADAPQDPAAALTRGRALLVAGDASGARTALLAAARLGAAVGDEQRLLPHLEEWASVTRALDRMGELTTQIERDRPDPRVVGARLAAVVEVLAGRLERAPPWLGGLPRRLQADVWAVVAGLLELEDPATARPLTRLLALDPGAPAPADALCALCWWYADHGPPGPFGPVERLATVDVGPLARPLRFATQALVVILTPHDGGGPRDEAMLRLGLVAIAAGPPLSAAAAVSAPGDARRHERGLVRRLEAVIGERALALAWSARRDGAARGRLVATGREHLAAFRALERADFNGERRTQERALLAASHLLEAEVAPAAEIVRSLEQTLAVRSHVPDDRTRVIQVEVLLQAGDVAGAKAALALPLVATTFFVELGAQRAVVAALEGDADGADALLDAIEGKPAQLLPWRSASETRSSLATGWRPGQRPWVE